MFPAKNFILSTVLSVGLFIPAGAQAAPALFSANDVAVTEGNSGLQTATITLSLSKPISKSVGVAYWTTDGNAISGSDYKQHGGFVTLAPGQTVQKLDFQVIGDRQPEGKEFFRVQLRLRGVDSTDVEAARSTGTITILNDDGPPAVKPDGKIVFTSDRTGNREIYVVNADGSNLTRLTKTADTELNPQFSADGSQIAFITATGAIKIMKADGTGVRTIVAQDAGFTASFSLRPDGKQIAFEKRESNGNVVIYAIGVDGTNLHRISTIGSGPDSAPRYSPDGTHIAYFKRSSSADNTPQLGYVKNDGTGFVGLTPSNDIVGFYDVSPDSKQVVFSSAYISFISEEGEIVTKARPVALINTDGTGRTNLPNQLAGDDHHIWSHDGKTLLFVRASALLSIKPDGTGQQTVAALDETTRLLTKFSPAGTYLSATNDAGELQTLALDSSSTLTTIVTGQTIFGDWAPGKVSAPATTTKTASGNVS